MVGWYFVGDFDGHKFTCESKPAVTKWMDYGKDHYATVTFDNAPEGRRVAIAWMSNWQYANQVPTQQYRSGNSIPRDLGLFEYKGETYCSVVPSPEMTAARSKKAGNKLTESCEMVVNLKGDATITLSNDKGEKVVMNYDAKAETFSMDRTKSGKADFSNDFAATTKAPTYGKISQLRIFIDKSSIEDTLCGVPVRLGPLSFYQVNTLAAERLYGIAAEYAQLTPDDLLLDLYCGMGTIGLSMADHCRELIGVEIVPEAIESAKANAARMGDAIAAKSRFFCADAGKAASQLAAEGLHPDVVMLDPPRKGCDEATLSAVVTMSPRRVVYVSCNPSTAARDAKWLEEHGYRAEKVQPVDLFPRTRHCEVVSCYTKTM